MINAGVSGGTRRSESWAEARSGGPYHDRSWQGVWKFLTSSGKPLEGVKLWRERLPCTF